MRKKFDASAKRTAVIETFEGFTYRLNLVPVKGGGDAVLMTVNVSANLAKERKVEAGESPEDAKAKSEAFITRMKSLEEKLAKESKLNGRTFELSPSTVEPLVKDRSGLVAKAEAPTPGDGAQGSVQQTPGGLIATPPVQAVGQPMEAPSQGE